MDQFVDPETDTICQFLDPETDIMGERTFMTEIVEILTFNISLCIFWKFLCITRSLKLRIKMASNQFVPLAKCF